MWGATTIYAKQKFHLDDLYTSMTRESPKVPTYVNTDTQCQVKIPKVSTYIYTYTQCLLILNLSSVLKLNPSAELVMLQPSNMQLQHQSVVIASGY